MSSGTKQLVDMDQAIPPSMKRCSACRIEKPNSDFHKNQNKPDRLRAHCKRCTSKSKRSQYKSKERKRERTIGFDPVVSDSLSKSAVDSFSLILGDFIQGLIDEEKL